MFLIPIKSSQRDAWLIVFAAILATIPLLMPDIQALIDLPGHVAELHIADSIRRHGPLERYFEFGWRPIPNLGMELLARPLQPLIGTEMAVKIIVAAVPGLMVVGILWLAREIHGRLLPTSVMALPLAYSYPLTFGFVNSCLSIAFALTAFAWWLRLSRLGQTRRRNAITFAIVAPFLFFTHILGLCLLGLLSSGWVVSKRLSQGAGLVEAVRDLVLACLPMAWPFVFLALWRTGGHFTTDHWLDLSTRGVWLGSLVRERFMAFDLFSAMLLYLVAALPLLARRQFTVTTLTTSALALWIIALMLPTRLMGSEFASVRLFPVACALSIIAVRPRQSPPAWAMSAALGFVGLRLALSGFALVEASSDAQREIAGLDHIAVGSRVAAFRIVSCEGRWQPPRLQDIGNYALIRRDAFVNATFAQQEGQLITIRPENPKLLALPDENVLTDAPCDRRWPPVLFHQAIAALPWDSIDYLWLVDVPQGRWPSDPRLTPVWHNDDAIIYRIHGG